MVPAISAKKLRVWVKDRLERERNLPRSYREHEGWNDIVDDASN